MTLLNTTKLVEDHQAKNMISQTPGKDLASRTTEVHLERGKDHSDTMETEIAAKSCDVPSISGRAKQTDAIADLEVELKAIKLKVVEIRKMSVIIEKLRAQTQTVAKSVGEQQEKRVGVEGKHMSLFSQLSDIQNHVDKKRERVRKKINRLRNDFEYQHREGKHLTFRIRTNYREMEQNPDRVISMANKLASLSRTAFSLKEKLDRSKSWPNIRA